MDARTFWSYPIARRRLSPIGQTNTLVAVIALATPGSSTIRDFANPLADGNRTTPAHFMNTLERTFKNGFVGSSKTSVWALQTLGCEEIWNSCSVGLRDPIKFHISGFTKPSLNAQLCVLSRASRNFWRRASRGQSHQHDSGVVRDCLYTFLEREAQRGHGEYERPAECGGRFGRTSAARCARRC